MEACVTRLGKEMHEVRAERSRIKASVNRIEATLPFLATKSHIAELRSEVKAGIAEPRRPNIRRRQR